MSKTEEYVVQINHNKQIHDLVAATYDDEHVDIYNPTEQARIRLAISNAMSNLNTLSETTRILDFGAGTGNLTNHLLELGTNVVAADVSPQSLSALAQKYPGNDHLETIELNGVDLSNFSDECFDMLVTYSVLHHVPDYLSAVREFVRVVKPGGVIYVDHEVCPTYWFKNTNYDKYQSQMRQEYKVPLRDKAKRKLVNFFSYSAWKRLFNRQIFGLHPEGDIHVTKDDHIEWDLIEEILSPHCEIVTQIDYLVCRERTQARPIHRHFEGECMDMRMIVARKKK